MATSEDLLQQILDQLRRSGSDGLLSNINRLSDSADSAADNLNDVERSSKSLKKNQDELARDFKTFGKKDIGDLKYKLENTARNVKDFARSVRDAEQRVKDLEHSTDVAAKANAQAALQAKKSQLDEIATRQRLLERNVEAHIDYVESIDRAGQALGSFAKNLASGLGTLANSLQSGGSAISTAGGILSTGITAAGNLGSAAGAGLSAAGSAASAFGKKGRAVGAGLDLLGMAVSGLSKGMSALASAVLPYMIKEVERTLASFQTMSAAGAVFADGMTGMRHAASSAGLSLETFSKIMTANSESFGATGLGVTGAAKKFAEVSNIMAKSGIQQQILNLGYSLEEYGSLTADVMADLNRTGGLRSVSDAEIAGITGEDAKKKLAAVRAENDILAFQQKLAQMGPKQQQAINLAMATMSKEEQKNLRERIVYGSVINQEGAIMEASIPAIKDKMDRMMQLYNMGELNAETAARANADYADRIKEGAMGATGLAQAAMAGGGAAGGATNAIFASMQNALKYTKQAVEGGVDGVAKQAATQDDLTTSTVGAVIAIEAMRVEMEKIVMDSGALKNFAKMLESVTDTMREAITELGGAVKGDTTKGAAIGGGIGGVAGAAAGGLAGRAAGGLAGRALGGLGGSLLGPAGTFLGMAAGGALGDYLGGKIGEAISGLLGTGKALGGISAGPDSGYLEKLHGVEAVVPLPDGRSIPVTMDSSGDSAMLNLMKEQVELFKNMLDSLRNSEDLQDRMLSNSY